MNWLITGGCGFLGTALIRRLVEQGGHSIRVVDNLTNGTRSDLGLVSAFREVAPSDMLEAPKGIELVVGDILDAGLALRAAAGCDVVVHFAANTGVAPSVADPRADMQANVCGTFNYLEAARTCRVPRFVFASSGAPAGEVEPPIHEEMAPHPVSPYGASKLAGEGYCSAYFRTFGVETVALRFGNVYGPGSSRKSSVVAKFIRRALAGEVLEIYGDGSQTRDFIYVEDLIDAVLLAATVPGIGGEIFQIATSRETTVDEIATRIASSLEQAGVSGVRVANAASRLGDVKRNFSDTSKAKARLGWQATMDLAAGIDKTVSYFLSGCNS